MPNLSFHPEVMLPASHIPWLLSQPDGVMDLHEVIQDSLSFGLGSPHDAVLANPFHDTIIKQELSKNLGAITIDVVEELSDSIDDLWGKDTENWNEVCVWDTMQQIVARTSNRIFVGLPLCRNMNFLHHARAFAVAMVNQIGVVRYILPAVLAPFLGHIFALPCHYHDRQVAKILTPHIKARIAALNEDPDSKSHHPNDLLQWLITHSLNSPTCTPRDAQPRYLASRISICNFAALHTSTITITNTFLDLFSSPNAPEYYAAIRQEATAVLAAHTGTWTKAAVAQLVKTDSALRETLRHTGLGGRSLVREVVAKAGVTTPDGTHLPHGARIGVAASQIHHDEAHYENAHAYDAFRFSDLREKLASSSHAPNPNNHTVVTTSPTFLTFGHGRRACPGRFFAAHELKLLLALVSLRYEIKPIEGGRPENTWISDLQVPPTGAKLSVRRRKDIS